MPFQSWLLFFLPGFLAFWLATVSLTIWLFPLDNFGPATPAAKAIFVIELLETSPCGLTLAAPNEGT